MHAHKCREMIDGQILIYHFKTLTTAATYTFSISYNQHVIPLFSAHTHTRSSTPQSHNHFNWRQQKGGNLAASGRGEKKT